MTEQNSERLIAYVARRAADCVPEAFRLALADVVDVAQFGCVLDCFEEFLFPGFFKLIFEVWGSVEVVLEGALGCAGDHEEVVESRVDCFFDDVLDGWSVDDRQHLFGHRFRGGEETGSKAGHREDSFTDFELVHSLH